ncbi:STAS domain-containing protein [Robbsia sp. Bb-Pol-6]|uniref:STAS domain-containing protein n=1 Tax=Robbsia betulipollinis TaxID=2981849 RepID=A0ABT3ZGU5_9BURK|nr:STAS domain-containing protein [Robbsia betulipollinis]MCY0385738.1 STAS domain-containing protein [Robbsia betulipollinis]
MMSGTGPGTVARTPAGAWPVYLSIDGEMTIYRASELKELIARTFHGDAAGDLPAVLGSNRDVDLDLSAVSALDAAGLQLLLLFNRPACMDNRRLRLVAPSAAVQDALALVHLSSAFECVPSERNLLTVSRES